MVSAYMCVYIYIVPLILDEINEKEREKKGSKSTFIGPTKCLLPRCDFRLSPLLLHPILPPPKLPLFPSHFWPKIHKTHLDPLQ